MARLCIQSKGFDNQLIELKLGVNRLGRSPANDFEIDDPTISAEHCEIVLGDQELRVHDCNSTNGTYVDGQPICDGIVRAGQRLRLGEIELLVESTEVKIAIPHFEVPRPAPPVVLSNGSLLCPRHPQSEARYRCTHCHEVMCESCLHRLRRRGGKTLTLCPLCSYPCELVGGEKKKRKRSLLAFLRETIKLPLFRLSRT